MRILGWELPSFISEIYGLYDVTKIPEGVKYQYPIVYIIQYINNENNLHVHFSIITWYSNGPLFYFFL